MPPRPWVAAICLVIGCGRIGFAPTSDAPFGDDVLDDASGDALGMFSPPTPLTELNTTTDREDDPSFTDDLLEVYFQSDRSGTERIYVAKRATTSDMFTGLVFVTELDAGGLVNNPKVSGDGLTIVFTSDRAPSMALDLWFSTRASRTMPWSAPQRIAELATTANDQEPWLSADGLTMYFASDRSGTYDLWTASRPTLTSPFGPAAPLTALSTTGVESSPWTSGDERYLIFNSDVAGTKDLYEATRSAKTDPFGAPVAMSAFNTNAIEEDPWMSNDSRTFAFMSTRTGGGDIYITTR